ncbi:S8 family peptidase [Solitalea longa]|nr:S8 family serine peptidase [Solitalea longa]
MKIYALSQRILSGMLVASLLFGCSKQDEVQKKNALNVTKQNNQLQSLTAGKTSSKAYEFTNNFILIAQSTNSLPVNIESEIQKSGGKFNGKLNKIGLAFVSSDDSDFINKASKIKGVQAVIHDIRAQWFDPNENVVSQELVAESHTGFPSPDDDFYFPLEWGMLAIDAKEAWAKGYKGNGATVAVLDGGFDLDHPDLAPNINLGISQNFVPGETLEFASASPFSHGTHVAGTIAAADNAFGVIGVAPQAKLMLVKVLRDSGSGDFSWLMQGIIYAADNGANVINMSLGALIPHHFQEKTPDGVINETKEIQQLLVAMNRVTTYAYQKGVTIIAAAGNDALDFNHSKDLEHYPSNCSHVISISASSPIGWAKNFATDLDVPTTYTNFGTSGVSLAAPGGDIYPSVTGNCTVVIGAPCYAFDLVFSTGNNSWYWSGGTSMASPHAAGVAALIVGKYNGNISPAQVESILKRSADDKGKPGKDDYFGSGRVNAGKAVDL